MYRDTDIKQRTIKVAKDLFFQNGYTSVSIEDIIGEASISKKTLYRYFVCKDDILNEVIDDFIKDFSSDIETLLAKKEIDFAEKLRQVFSTTAVSFSKISAKFTENIRQYEPHAWNKLKEFKREAFRKCYANLMAEGTRRGHISKDINKEVASLILLIAIENLFDPDFLEQMPKELVDKIPISSRDTLDAIIKIIYAGILTEETKKKYLQS